MTDKMLDTIARFGMLVQGDCVTVALSGGADSVSLLCALYRQCQTLGLREVRACHVNHRLRGAQSDADEIFCRALCERLHLALTVVEIDVPQYCKENKLSIEEGARQARYDALLNVCGTDGKLATAHTLSDSAETMLLNLARGSGLDGLCGIPPIRGRIIRPLIEISRAQVEEYLASLGQAYVTDATNLLDLYSRNRIRHQVIPQLERINPAFESTAARARTLLSLDRDCLEQQAEDALSRAELPQGGWSVQELSTLHPAIRLRAVKRLLRNADLPYDAVRLALCDKLFQTPGAVELTSGRRLVCQKGRMELSLSDSTSAATPLLMYGSLESLPLSVDFDGKTIHIRELSPQEIKFFVNNHPIQFKNALDCAKIERIFRLRSRKPGDRIRLLARGCTKTLKKLMNETTIPVAQRERIAVVESEGEPVWVERFGVCEQVSLTEETRRAVMIEINEEE